MTSPGAAQYRVEVEHQGEVHTPERTYGMSKAAATWAGLLIGDVVAANPDFFDQGQREAAVALLDRLGELTDDDFTAAELDLRACCDHPAHSPGRCPVTGTPRGSEDDRLRTCDCDGFSPTVAVDWAPGTEPAPVPTLVEPGVDFIVRLYRTDPA